MNYYGRIKCETTSEIPDEFISIAKCWIFKPRPEIDVTIATSSHIIEIKNGINLRSGRLPESLPAPDKIDLLLTNKGWFYVVESDDCLLLYSGETLKETKRFNSITSFRIGDFLNLSKSLLLVFSRHEDPILSDGFTQYDVSQVWPPDKVNKNSQDAFSQRLNTSKCSLDRSRLELEATKTFVKDTLRSLAASYCNTPTLKEGSLQNIVHKSKTQSIPQDLPVLEVSDPCVRLVRDRIVVLVKTNTNQTLRDLAIQCVCEGDIELSMTSSTIKLRDERGLKYPETSSRLTPGQQGFGLIIVPESLVSLSRSDCINLFITVSSNLGRSFLTKVTLTPDLVLTATPALDDRDSAGFLSDFVALSGSGVHERLQLSTELGALAEFTTILENLGFSLSTCGLGYFFRKPGEYFHGSFILHKPLSNQEVIADIFCADYSALGTLVKLLRTKLPCDTKISPFTSS